MDLLRWIFDRREFWVEPLIVVVVVSVAIWLAATMRDRLTALFRGPLSAPKRAPAQQTEKGPPPEQWSRARNFQFDLQSALLGEITPNIRGVTFLCHDEHIRIRFIFDGPLSSQDEDTVDVVDARVSTYTYESKDGWAGTWATETLRLDYPEDVTPFKLDAWAYRRREDRAGQPDGAAQPPLPLGWELVADAGTAFALMRELGRETGNERHVLRHQGQGFAIARSVSSDDVLFAFSDGRVGVVHLTWSGKAENDPLWPFTRLYDSIAEFRRATSSEPPRVEH